MKRNYVEPKFRLVEIEETQYWSDDVQARGRIFAVYLVDLSRHTYLCEMTPSLELTYMYTTTRAAFPDDRDALQDLVDLEEMGSARGSVSYVHAHTKFNRVRRADLEKTEKRELAAGEITYDDLAEFIREYYCANHQL